MVKLTILYPNTPGKNFDMDYFCARHMVMVKTLFGDACKGMYIDEGIRGIYNSPFIAMGSFLFESGESLLKTAVPLAKEITLDIPNFTDITPQINASIFRLEA